MNKEYKYAKRERTHKTFLFLIQVFLFLIQVFKNLENVFDLSS